MFGFLFPLIINCFTHENGNEKHRYFRARSVTLKNSAFHLYFSDVEYFDLLRSVRSTEINSVSVKMQSFAYSTFTAF